MTPPLDILEWFVLEYSSKDKLYVIDAISQLNPSNFAPKYNIRVKILFPAVWQPLPLIYISNFQWKLKWFCILSGYRIYLTRGYFDVLFWSVRIGITLIYIQKCVTYFRGHNFNGIFTRLVCKQLLLLIFWIG